MKRAEKFDRNAGKHKAQAINDAACGTRVKIISIHSPDSKARYESKTFLRNNETQILNIIGLIMFYQIFIKHLSFNIYVRYIHVNTCVRA